MNYQYQPDQLSHVTQKITTIKFDYIIQEQKYHPYGSLGLNYTHVQSTFKDMIQIKNLSLNQIPNAHNNLTS